MATYHIGQRVKVLAAPNVGRPESTGTITSVLITEDLAAFCGGAYHWVELDRVVQDRRTWRVLPAYLRPLTDPEADKFIATMNKLTPTDLTRLREEDYQQEKEVL